MKPTHRHKTSKVKVWILDIALLHDKSREQQRFTIFEVAADWHANI